MPVPSSFEWWKFYLYIACLLRSLYCWHLPKLVAWFYVDRLTSESTKKYFACMQYVWSFLLSIMMIFLYYGFLLITIRSVCVPFTTNAVFKIKYWGSLQGCGAAGMRVRSSKRRACAPWICVFPEVNLRHGTLNNKWFYYVFAWTKIDTKCTRKYKVQYNSWISFGKIPRATMVLSYSVGCGRKDW